MSTLELEHIKHTSSSSNNLSVHSDGTLTLGNLTSLNVNGNLGIGTTTGSESLNTTGNIRLQTNNKVRLEYLNTSGAYVTGTTGGAALGFEYLSGGADHEIFFETHNSGVSHREVMRIDKDGYVTTPYQPMVRMSLGSNFGLNNVYPSGPGAKITGFVVHENIGNHWNNSNSNFTCPVAGVYCVSIFFIKYPASGAAHVDLHKNNSHVNDIRWRAPEVSNGYHQVGGTVFVTCAANDVLDWKYFGGPGMHNNNGQWGIRLVG